MRSCPAKLCSTEDNTVCLLDMRTHCLSNAAFQNVSDVDAIVRSCKYSLGFSSNLYCSPTDCYNLCSGFYSSILKYLNHNKNKMSLEYCFYMRVQIHCLIIFWYFGVCKEVCIVVGSSGNTITSLLT